jgi:ArsR family transcriptional regulator
VDVISDAAALFRLLGDPTRLRLMRILARDRFNVTELTGILGLAQSGVSRHLGLLKDAELVVEEREAGYVYYRLARGSENPRRREQARVHAPGAGVQANVEPAVAGLHTSVEPAAAGLHTRVEPVLAGLRTGDSPLWPLLDAQFAASNGDRAVQADEARLEEVLRLRQENFDTHGDARQLVPGRSWAAWARALGHLLPPLEVADLGCGEGYLTVETARWAKSVVAVDKSNAVLERARDLARRRRVTNIIWKQGDLAKLPLKKASVDVALLSQALHHAAHPDQAVAEAVRILRPGGRLLVLDLRAHDQAWVRERLGDERLGFDDDELARLLKNAGLAEVSVSVGARKTGDPFTVLIASGTRHVH